MDRVGLKEKSSHTRARAFNLLAGACSPSCHCDADQWWKLPEKNTDRSVRARSFIVS